MCGWDCACVFARGSVAWRSGGRRGDSRSSSEASPTERQTDTQLLLSNKADTVCSSFSFRDAGRGAFLTLSRTRRAVSNLYAKLHVQLLVKGNIM